MKKLTRFIIVIVVIGLLIFLGVRFTGKAVVEVGKYDDFAQCLTDSGTKMYGAYWCPHCKEQKKAFGSSWKYINYIECALPNGGQTVKCTQEGISGYPTWEFAEGERAGGFTSLSELGLRAGCELPE